MANQVKSPSPSNPNQVGDVPTTVDTTQLEHALHNHFQQRGFNLTGVDWAAAIVALEALLKALSPVLSSSRATSPGGEVHKAGT